MCLEQERSLSLTWFLVISLDSDIFSYQPIDHQSNALPTEPLCSASLIMEFNLKYGMLEKQGHE